MWLRPPIAREDRAEAAETWLRHGGWRDAMQHAQVGRLAGRRRGKDAIRMGWFVSVSACSESALQFGHNDKRTVRCEQMAHVSRSHFHSLVPSLSLIHI